MRDSRAPHASVCVRTGTGDPGGLYTKKKPRDQATNCNPSAQRTCTQAQAAALPVAQLQNRVYVTVLQLCMHMHAHAAS